MKLSLLLLISLTILGAGCTNLKRHDEDGLPIAHRTFDEAEAAEIAKCLPDGFTLDMPFATDYRRNQTTVRLALEDIGARCKAGKLVDSQGREIYFFQAPEGEETGFTGAARNENFRRAGERLSALKDRYHVIEMYALTRLPPR